MSDVGVMEVLAAMNGVGKVLGVAQQWMARAQAWLSSAGDWAVTQWLRGVYLEHLAPVIDALPLTDIGMSLLLLTLVVAFLHDAGNGRI